MLLQKVRRQLHSWTLNSGIRWCKVVLNFLPGSGFAEDADFSNGIIRFASLHPTGTFNTITGSAEINAEEAGGLEFIAGTTIVPAGNTYSFILLPETVSGGVALSFIQEVELSMKEQA